MNLYVSGLFISLTIGQIAAFIDKPVGQYLEEKSQYSILASLIKQAGLTSTLNSGGPYTVFAPTDDAFAKLPASELQSLRNNPTALSAVLQAHVVQGYILAPQLQDGTTETSINGQTLTFAKNSSGITVNKAQVSNSDIIVNNGVVHEIDSVILELVTESIGEILLERQAQFSTLDLLLTITNLEPVLLNLESTLPMAPIARLTKVQWVQAVAMGLQGQRQQQVAAQFEGQYTLFAPTNDAFNSVSAALPDIRSQSDKDRYAEILKNHLISGLHYASSLTDGQMLTTLHGQTVTIHLNPSAMVNNANITETDIKATNGVIHAIDAVLVPTDVDLS